MLRPSCAGGVALLMNAETAFEFTAGAATAVMELASTRTRPTLTTRATVRAVGRRGRQLRRRIH